MLIVSGLLELISLHQPAISDHITVNELVTDSENSSSCRTENVSNDSTECRTFQTVRYIATYYVGETLLLSDHYCSY